jgi:hypothetical protein
MRMSNNSWCSRGGKDDMTDNCNKDRDQDGPVSTKVSIGNIGSK